MQAQKVGQQSIFIATPQLGLKDSQKSTSEEGRRNNLWVMDKKFLNIEGLGSQMIEICFLHQPNKVI